MTTPYAQQPAARTGAESPREYRLVMSGCREPRGYLVNFNGTEVALSQSLFNALQALLAARFSTELGYTHFHKIAASKVDARTTICRLRARIDAAHGAGAGKALIVNGNRSEYRLALTRGDVDFENSFFDDMPTSSARRELLAALQHQSNQNDIGPTSVRHI